MEREFARFHERTGTTMIYITHDQTEAMALADRIAVMDKGRVLQAATPTQLYREPADETVASFIGEGMVIPVQVLAVGDDATCEVDLFGLRVRMRCANAQKAAAAARACLHASALRIVEPNAAGLRAHVDVAIYQGGHFRVEAHVDAHPEHILHLTAQEPCNLAPGAAINVAVDDGWVIPASTKD
jgi:iron(III) transport system ATP-binding protein